MKTTLARIAALAALGAAVTGCATADGYYYDDPYYAPGYVYSTPGYPAYAPAPSVIYYGDRDSNRWDRDHRHRNERWERERAREHAERERDRAERERVARARERELGWPRLRT